MNSFFRNSLFGDGNQLTAEVEEAIESECNLQHIAVGHVHSLAEVKLLCRIGTLNTLTFLTRSDWMDKVELGNRIATFQFELEWKKSWGDGAEVPRYSSFKRH